MTSTDSQARQYGSADAPTVYSAQSHGDQQAKPVISHDSHANTEKQAKANWFKRIVHAVGFSHIYNFILCTCPHLAATREGSSLTSRVHPRWCFVWLYARPVPVPQLFDILPFWWFRRGERGITGRMLLVRPYSSPLAMHMACMADIQVPIPSLQSRHHPAPRHHPSRLFTRRIPIHPIHPQDFPNISPYRRVHRRRARCTVHCGCSDDCRQVVRRGTIHARLCRRAVDCVLDGARAGGV